MPFASHMLHDDGGHVVVWHEEPAQPSDRYRADQQCGAALCSGQQRDSQPAGSAQPAAGRPQVLAIARDGTRSARNQCRLGAGGRPAVRTSSGDTSVQLAPSVSP